MKEKGSEKSDLGGRRKRKQINNKTPPHPKAGIGRSRSIGRTNGQHGGPSVLGDSGESTSTCSPALAGRVWWGTGKKGRFRGTAKQKSCLERSSGKTETGVFCINQN